MAQIQKQFDKFNSAIMLRRFGENETLREKRDIVRNRLKEQLPQVFEQHDDECPSFYFRDQGSYEMGTGIKPLDGDYDIDQGLYLEVGTSAYPDPVTVKKYVHESLAGHTSDVRIRRPCITVFYQREGEPIYHVDIAVYSDGSKNPDGKSRLAIGRENSAPEYRSWEVSDPQALTETILSRFEGANRDQFRRVIRYLKRWKDVNFPSDGNAAPLGIGLTILTYDELTPCYSDVTSQKPDDMTALRGLVRGSIARFESAWDEAESSHVRRLSVSLPVEPWNDLFEQMANKQMADLEERLQNLLDALDTADEEVDPVEACKTLQKVFGDDFPVPTKEETAKKQAPAIVSSSHSA